VRSMASGITITSPSGAFTAARSSARPTVRATFSTETSAATWQPAHTQMRVKSKSLQGQAQERGYARAAHLLQKVRGQTALVSAFSGRDLRLLPSPHGRK
jgi:hypothetical protein